VIGAGLILVLGVPSIERLMGRIRPLTPRQEEAEHFRRQARRSIDRFRR
jgi:hypothetical protein